MSRIFSPEDIPLSLWDKSKDTLTLPRSIISSWQKILDEKGLLKEATENNVRSEIGGINEEATNKHYSFNYNGSCARFQLAFLDPKDELKEVSNTFVKVLAGGNIFIADTPSGTGAASLSLLCNIAQLREEKVMPTSSLKVKILAGEISETAIEIFQNALDKINDYLLDYSIEVELETELWDITDKDSTSQLIKKLTLISQHSKTKLLLLANFTGFLEKDRKWDSVTPQFEELFRHFSGKSTNAIWLEPGSKNAVKGFLPRLKAWFLSKFKQFVSSKEDIKIETSEAFFNHGLRDTVPRTNVSVLRFNTERI
jgi:hypothetical protein